MNRDSEGRAGFRASRPSGNISIELLKGVTMMMFQTHWALRAVVCLLALQPLAFAHSGNTRRAEDVISEIARHEEVLQNISARIVVTIPDKDKTFMVVEWGYSHGREYVEGTKYLNVREVGENIPHSFKSAFDGEIMRIYREDPLVKRDNGRVTSLEPESFTGFPTPNTLLGHHLYPTGRLTTAEALRGAKEVHLQPDMQDIDGHPCYALDVIEVYPSSELGWRAADARLWVDPARDYRVLKLELYKSAPPPMRWKEARWRVDKIKLQQIHGTWIPVEGDSHSLTTEEVPKPGVSEEALRNMDPEEVPLHLDFKPVPRGPMMRVQVDVDSLSFGKQIPLERFTIQWPAGTTIWDDFIQTAYKVGAQGAVSLRDSPVDELPEVPAPRSHGDTNSNTDSDVEDASHVNASSSDRNRSVPLVLILSFVLLCCVGLIYVSCRYYKRRTG